ncbi:MAG: RNA polymerase sigma factor [Propionibacteriaceae bacterium]|nr:RNA polymerase sigma factor [Propionibacteriaceae bacterium]
MVLQQESVQAVPNLDSHQGFSHWVLPHWAAMSALAARTGPDAEDVLQDALTQAWRKRRQFDPVRGSARNWLLAITADQRRKHWRRSAARPETALAGHEALISDSAGPVSEHCLDLERAIASLSKRQGLAVELHYYLGLPISDIAQIMRCSPGTVKSTLADARARLLDRLGKDYR